MKSKFRMNLLCHAEFSSASLFESQVRGNERDPEILLRWSFGGQALLRWSFGGQASSG